MKDITDISDIELLVKTFYQQATKDELIGRFFSEVVPLDFDHHLPRMYQFWEGVLFGQTAYRGNPMLKHIELHRKSPLRQQHFDRWLTLWNATVSTLFEGEVADKAKTRARSIRDLMQYKVENVQ